MSVLLNEYSGLDFELNIELAEVNEKMKIQNISVIPSQV